MSARGMRREDFHTLVQRLLRVARLDATAFLEVRDEANATLPAMLVVLLASLFSGIGGWLLYVSSDVYLRFGPLRDNSSFFVRSVIGGTIIACLAWAAWVAVTMAMLEYGWKREVSLRALVRTMGLGYFPVALSVFMFIQFVATPVALISLAAAVLLSGVAVEASTEAEPAEVLFANLVGFAVFALALGLLGRDHNWWAPGLFAFGI